MLRCQTPHSQNMDVCLPSDAPAPEDVWSAADTQVQVPAQPDEEAFFPASCRKTQRGHRNRVSEHNQMDKERIHSTRRGFVAARTRAMFVLPARLSQCTQYVLCFSTPLQQSLRDSTTTFVAKSVGVQILLSAISGRRCRQRLWGVPSTAKLFNVMKVLPFEGSAATNEEITNFHAEKPTTAEEQVSLLGPTVICAYNDSQESSICNCCVAPHRRLQPWRHTVDFR